MAVCFTKGGRILSWLTTCYSSGHPLALFTFCGLLSDKLVGSFRGCC